MTILDGTMSGAATTLIGGSTPFGPKAFCDVE
jgi:hypothetical protein